MIEKSLTPEQMYSVIYSDTTDPFSVLGLHVEENGKIAIRCYDPYAETIFVKDLSDNSRYEMQKLHKSGFFEIILDDKTENFKYKLIKIDSNGNETEEYDTYSFLPILSEEDLYLYNRSNLNFAYNSLGVHIVEKEGVKGTVFAVWAPTARRVSVVGDFNKWDGRVHTMRLRGSSGIWELFIPEILDGDLYKYEIYTQYRQNILKMDPFAFRTEKVPNTASYVYDIDKYKWNDSEWMEQRKKRNYRNEPMSIYEVHLGSWMRTADGKNEMLNYVDLANNLVKYVKEMGYTHIELLPVAEHPFSGSWGYQVTGYYAPTSRFGTPDQFMYLIDICHQNGISVILDWVPAHFPKDIYSLARYDGTCLYEHQDPRQGEHMDWGTLIFNFGRNEVRNFLISNALFWFDKYHADGLRIDAVASMLYLDYSRKPGQWIPNKYGGHENLDAVDFLKQLNTVIGKYYPEVMMIAEESTAWPLVSAPVYMGGLGFSYKWNMGWMNDMLRYMSTDPLYRKYHQSAITFSLMYAFSEKFVLPLSHDEIVHGKGSLINKMPGSDDQKVANLKLLFAYMFAHPGKKLLFQGSDFGQPAEWNHDKSIDWHLLNYEPFSQISRFTKDLLHVYRENPALYQIDFDSKGFQWIDFKDSNNSVVSFIRKDETGRKLIIGVFNFTPVMRRHYKIGVPAEGFYREILNSDSAIYGGYNYGNLGGVYAEPEPMHEMPYSIDLTLPPLGALYFAIELPEPEPVQEPVVEESKAEKIKVEEVKKEEDKVEVPKVEEPKIEEVKKIRSKRAEATRKRVEELKASKAEKKTEEEKTAPKKRVRKSSKK